MDPNPQPQSTPPRPRQAPVVPIPRSARHAVTAIFAINGLILSNWVPRIPAVQRNLDLSEGRLGLALLGVAVGALLAMPLIGGLVARFGSRPTTTVAVVALAASVPLPALAGSLATLTLALVALGAANGALDVAMNSQAVAVERRFRRPIMSSFHAAFSFGGLAGAILGGLAAAAGLDPLPHLTIVGVLGIAAGFLAARGLLPAAADAQRPTSSSARRTFPRPSRRLVGLGALAFACLLGEGAMADWSAVYLDGSLGTGPGLAAAGFAAFSLTMTFGRLIGDRLAARWGPVALARWGGVLVAVSLALALVVQHPAAAIAGFGGVGAGLSGIVPVVFSAAGRIPNLAPGPAIAAVSTVGYSGFLVGPPVIGLLAEISSLGIALGLVVLMGALIAALAGSVAPAGEPASRLRPLPAEGA